jgi:hypothetical protein
MLLLCVASGLWARSYWRGTFAARYARFYEGDCLHTDEIEMKRGCMLLIHDTWNRGGDPKREYVFHDFSTDSAPIDVDLDLEKTRTGFGWTSQLGPVNWGYVFSVPCWFLISCMLAIYAWSWIWWRNKFSSGLCEMCGYDLRATPDRCPECGTIPPTKKAVAST